MVVLFKWRANGPGFSYIVWAPSKEEVCAKMAAYHPGTEIEVAPSLVDGVQPHQSWEGPYKSWVHR